MINLLYGNTFQSLFINTYYLCWSNTRSLCCFHTILWVSAVAMISVQQCPLLNWVNSMSNFFYCLCRSRRCVFSPSCLDKFVTSSMHILPPIQLKLFNYLVSPHNFNLKKGSNWIFLPNILRGEKGNISCLHLDSDLMKSQKPEVDDVSNLRK